jgi:hypothetical protein
MSSSVTHSWTPSAARILAITGFWPRPRGAPLGAAVLAAGATPALPAWPPKDPADVLDYVYDIAPALFGDEGDSITQLDVTIVPSGTGALTLSASSANGQRAILWLGAGQSGTTYSVTLAIATVGGRSFQRTVLLPVISLSSEAAPGTVLLTDDGLPVLDDDGDPIIVEG